MPLVKDHNGDVCNVDNYWGITLTVYFQNLWQLSSVKVWMLPL